LSPEAALLTCANAIPIALTKMVCATIIGRNLVERSAARALDVCWQMSRNFLRWASKFLRREPVNEALPCLVTISYSCARNPRKYY
jgi:hypothetical protein